MPLVDMEKFAEEHIARGYWRRTLADLNETPVQRKGGEKEQEAGAGTSKRSLLGHHRDLCGGEEGSESESEESEATAELAESTHRPFAICPRSPRSVRAETEGHTREQAHEDRGFGCVYKVTHRESGKAYVGMTQRRFRQRMCGHHSKATGKSGEERKGCRKFHAAIRKYGWDAFDKRVLYAEVPIAMLPAMEIIAIAAHGTLTPNGYNLTPGGETSPMLDPDVKARAKVVMASEEVQAKRQKVFGSAEFKERVGKASSDVWAGYSQEKRIARAEHMAAASRAGWIAKREAKMAGMSPSKARSYWKELKCKGLTRARRMLRNHPERFVGRNPIADVEEWWGPSFEERRRA